MFTDRTAELMPSEIVQGIMFSATRHLGFGFFLTWVLTVCGSYLLFVSLLGGGSDAGETELACANAKLEALWDMPLPAGLEFVASKPRSQVATADWDLRELGCSGAVFPVITLQLQR
jgi:hypothetical protein